MYIDTHNGCIDTKDFENVVLNKIKSSASKNKWILRDYIKHIDLKKYKTLFQSLFIDIESKWTWPIINGVQVVMYKINKITYNFEMN
jgi:hypothetical protein